jgi:hypothetical protein
MTVISDGSHVALLFMRRRRRPVAWALINSVDIIKELVSRSQGAIVNRLRFGEPSADLTEAFSPRERTVSRCWSPVRFSLRRVNVQEKIIAAICSAALCHTKPLSPQRRPRRRSRPRVIGTFDVFCHRDHLGLAVGWIDRLKACMLSRARPALICWRHTFRL